MPKSLTFDELLDLAARKGPHEYQVQAWAGRTIYLREPSSADVDEWRMYCSRNQGGEKPLMAKLVAILLCDADGERIVPNTDEAVARLADSDRVAIDEIAKACLPLVAEPSEDDLEDEKKRLRADPWELFTYRLALHLGIDDVEAWKKRISRRQLRRWLAYWLVEPFGLPWLMAGRQTELIRSAFAGRFDRANEERFSITYREGDEHRSKVPLTDEQLAEKLSAIPGLKKTKLWHPRSAKSGRSSRRQRRD